MLLKQIYCCGTVRLNRRGMPEAIKAAKLKKRGQTITMQKGNLVATVWKDKKMVTYSSTNCDPTQQMRLLTTLKSKQNQNKYLYYFLVFLQVEYCIRFWSARSTPKINLL
jgi:hypothetical protein